MTDLEEKTKVLIADPAQISQLVLREDLEKAGYEVDIAKDFQEYEQKAKDFDIAILDVRLPGLNLADDLGPVKPTVILTCAYYEQSLVGLEETYAKYDNVYEYVPKPYFGSQIARWCKRIEKELK